MIAPGALTPFWIGSGQLYSTTVQEAMDNYTGLDAKDLALINSIITNLGSSYALIDEIFLFVLGSNVIANGSIGLKGTVGSLIDSPVFGIGGLTFDGGNDGFNTTINLSTDLTEASLDDIIASSFVKQNNSAGNGANLFGANDAGSDELEISQVPTLNRYDNSVNAAAQVGQVFSDGLFSDETLYGIERSDADDIKFIVDGVTEVTSAQASSNLPNEELFGGGWSNTGVLQKPLDGTLSTLSVSASIGFDNALFNTVIRNSLTAYETI